MNQFGQPKPPPFGPHSGRVDGMPRMDGPGSGMDRPPPGQIPDGFGPRLGGPQMPRMENPNQLGQRNSRMDPNLPSDFAALNLSIPSVKVWCNILGILHR